MVGGKLATPSNLFDWHIFYLGIYPFHVYAPNHLFYYQHTAQLLRHKILRFSLHVSNMLHRYTSEICRRGVYKRLTYPRQFRPHRKSVLHAAEKRKILPNFCCHLSAYLLNYSHKLFRAFGKLYPWSCVKNWWDSAKGFQNYGSSNWKGYGYPQVLATPGSETIWDPKTF